MRTIDKTDLHDYFKKLREGHTESFVQIYNELKVSVFTVCYRIVQSRELAEDITQDIFVKLFVSPPEESVKNIRAWIFRMTRNLCIDTIRKQHSVSLEETQAEPADAVNQNDIAMHIDLEEAISKLSVRQREVLSLHLDCDLNFREIASICDMSGASVYRLYRKTLKTLQELLGEKKGN